MHWFRALTKIILLMFVLDANASQVEGANKCIPLISIKLEYGLCVEMRF